MKKKLIVSILTAAIMATVLGGCGKGSAETPDNENVAAESKEENEKEDAPEMEAEPEETAEETGGPETSAAKETDWLEEHGLSITPQGEFTCSYSVYGFSDVGLGVMGEESEAANITVTETVEDGYKKIEAVFTCDFTGVEKYADGGDAEPRCTVFFFDRYTGILMPSCTVPVEILEDMQAEFSGQNLAACLVETEMVDGIVKGYKLQVLCPEDYDGTVFGVQSFSDRDTELRQLTTAPSLFVPIGSESMPEVGPYLDDGCVLFSASNE